jgi:hypothetical protein
VSLGVDRATLEQTPSVRDAVETFLDQVKAINGAKPVPTKLDAYTFEPAVVPSVKDALVAALEALVQHVQGIR